MWRDARHRLSRLCALVALALAPLAALCASPAHWKDVGYSYNANRTPLSRLLAEFAQSHGAELKLSARVSGTVNGRLQGATVLEFLERLTSMQRLQWFFYNNTLYVSPVSDAVFERIALTENTVSDAKAALVGLGLFEPKFGWGELPEERVVAISGPSEYLRLVKQVIQSGSGAKEDPEAMVFRLRYAAVEDRQVTIRDKVTVTPGVATLLKNMLSSRQGNTGHTGLSSQAAPSMSANPSRAESTMPMPNNLPLPGLTGMNALPGFMPPPAEQARSFGSHASGKPLRATQVEGDVRTNSIVIWDSPSKRNYYQRLIDALDVEQNLVEIEALIVDISQDRLKEIGAEFTVGGTKNSLSIGAAGAFARRGLAGGTLVLQSLDHFFAQLQLLEGQGEARILAKPSVLTLENLVAVLDLSQTVYLKSTGERVASVTPVTAGTMLRVIPRVIEEKNGPRVHLTVDIEDGKITERVAVDSPEVQRSTISTQAILENQASLVIGGYNSDSSAQRVQEVPGLSKVPLLGALFSSNHTSSQTKQRLFIITPRLVRPGAAPVAGLPAAVPANPPAAASSVPPSVPPGAADTIPQDMMTLRRPVVARLPDLPAPTQMQTPAQTRNVETIPADLMRLRR
ncbi:type III secretion system outer membrane ring subunit SctC [Noviherbaspirillum saxi]|uniref:Type 3 secretion system secretin n=1 Tax=Noviherbaspirillum saxi TaxID=2320863 RepID=A0A3A3FFN2_9BURK|nr:type III secretion system outer membrane ring subunit SctC [Noviherbaspirillum saxi]RJF92166.1 EscC/YscC/HrcC family type III secretion system outer membrane ring protein [Noviherbaspirillum saxi]